MKRLKEMKKSFLFAMSLLMASSVNAGVIGVWGGSFNTWNSYITNTGNTAVSVNSGSDLSELDQVWLIRQDGSANLIDYVNNGGTLVTEWSGAGWAVDTASLLDATATSLGFVGTGTSITFTSEATDLGLGTNTGNPYSNGVATQFFWSFTDLGSDVDVIATITGFDVGISGSYGNGNVLALGWDWQDTSVDNAITQSLVDDIVGISYDSVSVPEPSSIAFLCLGLASLGFSRKTRKDT